MADDLKPPTCPRCYGAMWLRTNSQTQQKFWGCAKYPDCHGTRQIGEPEDYNEGSYDNWDETDAFHPGAPRYCGDN